MEITTYAEVYKNSIIELILNIQQNEFGVPININDQPDLQDIPAYYQTGNGNFWVAIIDNQVAGTIALFDIHNGNFALRKMFVKSNYRGKEFGVGQALLSTVFTWCAEKKISNIFLGTTEKFLAAHRFYEKNGFTEIAKTLLPQGFPAMAVDVKFYHYEVPLKTVK